MASMLSEGETATGVPRTGMRGLVQRRSAANRRALVGGFLIASAAAATYAAAIQGGPPLTSYVVTTQAIAPGSRLTGADLTTLPMVLPRSLASQLAFTTPATLVGTVAVAPMRPGQLVQASEVVRASGAPWRREMSLSLEAARALDGSLSPGDTVDVLATYGTGSAAFTDLVVQAATVTAVRSTSGGIGGNATVTVTLSLKDSQSALALAEAINAGQIVLVRTTGDQQGTYAGPFTPSVTPSQPPGQGLPTGSPAPTPSRPG